MGGCTDTPATDDPRSNERLRLSVSPLTMRSLSGTRDLQPSAYQARSRAGGGYAAFGDMIVSAGRFVREKGLDVFC